MITFLVILFIILFIIQNFSSIKEKLTGRNISKFQSIKNIKEIIKQPVSPSEQSVYKKEDGEVNIAKATSAFQELNIRYDAGLINESDFNTGLSKILFSINLREVKRSA